MRFKVTATATRVYDVAPELYGPCACISDMLEMDKALILEDPSTVLDHESVHWEVEVEEALPEEKMEENESNG